MNTRLIVLTWLLAVVAVAVEPDSAAAHRLDRLTRWLRSPRESIRLEAITELHAIPIQAGLPLLIGATHDTGAVVRVAAAEALLAATDSRATAALRPLLHDGDDRVRAAAAWSLSHNAGPAILPELIALARHDPSGIVRYRAVWGLGIIGDKSALPVAVEALGDPVPAVRERAALRALEKLADNTLADRLRQQAGNLSPPTRRLVMYLFARNGSGKTALPVLQAGLKDSDPLVRGEAILSLGKRQAKDTAAWVRPACQDVDEHVRGVAAYVLGSLRDAGAKETLRSLLQDDSAFVRACAAEALQKLGDKTVKPPAGFVAAEIFTFPLYRPEREVPSR